MSRYDNLLLERAYASIYESKSILIPRRSKEDRAKNYQIALQKQITDYIKGGSEGDLDLTNTPIKSLPDNLKVGGHLILSETSIQSLPDNLEVGGNLYLSDASIQSLPDNLKVVGDLFLNGTPIQSLPDNLKVVRNLYLNNTPIQSLPDNLSVGGDLNLTYTPISKKYSADEIKDMVEYVGGRVIT